ncbi:ABC transporter permease [Embleya sp. NPDC050493]|uniref:ABC transporter permease n=1 Tax=Embleya sp. NPDC050493 TaxID=3363989 RepID=UPI003799465D
MSLLAIAAERSRLELKLFARQREQMAVTFGMPVLLLVLLGLIGGGTADGTNVPESRLHAAGMIAVGIVAAGFQGLALSVAAERQNGTLKRLRGTPMPPAAYLLGKIVQVFLVSLAQVAVLLAVGVSWLDLALPHDPFHWLTFGWVFLLGVAVATPLGLAAGALMKKGANGALIILPFTALQFVSGVFVGFNELPDGVQRFAALFPLKWLTQGMRSVFLPDTFQAVEPAGTWELGRVALVLAGWGVLGLVVWIRTFDWGGNER